MAVNRAGINWTYAYNELNGLTSENLAVDGRAYNLSYLYDTSANLTRRTTPTGTQINYTYDGRNRVNTVKNGASNIATGYAYHPSGAVSGFSYGNGQVFSQTLNPRLQPLRLRSVKGANKALDLTYAYDARGKVTSTTDAATSGNNRAYVRLVGHP